MIDNFEREVDPRKYLIDPQWSGRKKYTKLLNTSEVPHVSQHYP